MRVKPLALMVDDEEIFLEIASIKLQEVGFETVLANNVAEALAKAEALLPDLILSDIYMPPGPNGWDFVLELQKDPKTKSIKFAFFTSLRDPWTECTGQCRVAASEIPVTFFSKMDDVDRLGEVAKELIEK